MWMDVIKISISAWVFNVCQLSLFNVMWSCMLW